MTNYLILAAIGVALFGGTVSANGQRPVVTREIRFDVPDLTLVGTFEAPTGKGKFPAMLLLPGSGPTDRDDNSDLGLKTDVLKQIASALAQKGIASFRFDKRAIRHYSAAWPKTPEEMNHFFAWRKFVQDAEAGLKCLQSQPEIDPGRVGLLGHSEGALIALQIAAEMPEAKGGPSMLILIGGTGRPMGPVLHDQIARLLKIQKAPEPVAKSYLDYLDAACADLAEGKPLPPDTPTGLASLFNPTVLDIMGAYCRIDPAALAKQFAGPVLVMNGAHDTQVSPERDAPRLFEALKSRANGLQEILIVPNASHCLKETTPGNEDVFEGPIVPEALASIVKFAAEHLGV